MTRYPALRMILVAGACLASACDPCAGIAARIEALSAGERYAVPESCVVSEAVDVPAGATVSGGTFELGSGESITLAPSPDATRPTTLAGATVRGGNDATPAVVARGAGHVSIAAVSFMLERGIAVGVSGAEATLSDVTIEGNLDPSRALEIPAPVDPAALATFGVAAIEGATVTATSLTVRRAAVAGAFCADAALSITGATLEENLGLGVSAIRCDATLEDVEIARTVAAPQRPGIGIAALSSTLRATELDLHDAPGYGVLAGASDLTLTAPEVRALEQAGVWVEGGSSLVVDGGVFEDNRGAGIAAVGAARVEVHGATIRATGLAPIPTAGGTSLERMGDGIHVAQLADVASEVDLSDLVLANNERVGVVLDGAMRPLALSIVRTRVETEESELGALAQNVDALPAAWDAGVTRVGSAETLDAAAGPLVVSEGGLTGILMPPTIMF